MFDIVVESVNACLALVAFTFLVVHTYDSQVRLAPGWNAIVAGFGLLVFSMIIDVTDNFHELDFLVIVGHTQTEAFLKNIVGNFFGFVALGYGLTRWIPYVTRMAQSENQLAELSHTLQRKLEENKRWAQRMNDNELMHRAVVDNMMQGHITFDSRGIIYSSNPAMETLLGYSSEELIHKHISLFLSQESRAMGSGEFKPLQLGETRLPSLRCEVKTFPKRGSPLFLELGISELLTATQKIYSCVLHDSTQRRTVEVALRKQYEELLNLMSARAEELAIAKKEAERANRAKSEFLSRMSHELRTPLNAIIGYAQLLVTDEQQPLTPEQSSALNDMLRAGDHLLELINDALDISRIEVGNVNLALGNFDLVNTLCDCVQLVTPAAKSRDITVTHHICCAGRIDIQNDERRIRQMLINLLSNAVKYNKRAGTIDIDAKSHGNFITVSIRDSGIGMTKEQMNKLYEPFNRLGAEYSQIEGTGLGLAIVHNLCKLVESELTVHSEPGIGSEFTLTIPATHSAAQSQAPRAANL